MNTAIPILLILGLAAVDAPAHAAKAPDLDPRLIEAPELGSQEQTLVVTTLVKNRGQKASPAFEVRYFLSEDDTFDPAVDRLLPVQDGPGSVIETVVRPPLGKRRSQRWEQTLLIPEDVPQGEFFVGVTVDPQNLIAEKHESDNVLFARDETRVLKGLPLDDYPGAPLEEAGTPYQQGVNFRTIEVDGYTRTFVVYVPAGVLDGPDVPVVTMHHGSSGNGGQFLNISGWREKADAEGLIAVFPTSAMYAKVGTGAVTGELRGWSTKWNGYELSGLTDEFDFGVRPPGYPDGAPWPANDVLFENMVLDDLEALLPVDSRRLYASGFSNGAVFTARLAVETSDRYAAAAWVAGGLAATDSPTPVELIPTFGALGTKDDRVLEALGKDPINDEIELDPEVFLAYPLLEAAITLELDTFELVHDPDDPLLGADVVQQNAIATQLTWQTPGPGNLAGNLHHFAMLAGLVHHYPAGFHATKNPNGFVAADTFWDFFSLYQKP